MRDSAVAIIFRSTVSEMKLVQLTHGHELLRFHADSDTVIVRLTAAFSHAVSSSRLWL